MIRARKLSRLLACIVFCALLTYPVISAGVDPDCIKECADELVQCKKLCKEKIKDAEGQKNCIEMACTEMNKACLEDCRNE